MSEFIEILSPNALANLEKANTDVLQLIGNIEKINGKMKTASTPSGVDASIKATTVAIQQQEQAIVKTQAQIEKARLAEIKLQQARERAFDKYEGQLAKEQAKLQASESIYNKVQQKLNALSSEYKNLAVQKELTGKLTNEEAKRYDFLQGKIQKYDATLKAVDATMGKYQRNVGNYASGFNPLSNSINQLTREMPAFTYSVQTGFMALSNNIPIFTDAISNAIAQNKELQAQGKPTTSVLRQLAGAFLSWQTAMGIGITLLTVYGKEIGEFISSTFSASKAINVQKEAQKSLNEASTLGAKNAVEETLKLKSLLAIAKDTTLTYQQRMIAVKELQSTYPPYFANLKENEILAGNTEKAERALTDAILSRAKANAAVTKITENQSKIIDLELQRVEIQKQVDAFNSKIQQSQERINKSQDISIGQGKSLSMDIQSRNNLIEKLSKLTKEQTDIEKINQILTSFALEKQKEAILLDYKETKSKQEKLALSFKEVESEDNLRKAILERQKVQANNRASNDDLDIDARILARKEYSEKSIEILELEMQKEKAILNLQYTDDLAKNNLALRNKEITFKQYTENIKDIQKRFNNQLATVDLDYSLKWNDLLNSDAQYYRKFEEEKRNFSEQTQKIILDNEKAKFKKIADDETKTLEIRQKSFEEYLRLSKKELDIEKAKELARASSNEEVIAITERYAKLNKDLSDIKSPFVIAREDFEKYLEKLSSGQLEKSLNDIGLSSAKMFLDFDKNGQSTFEKLYAQAQTFGEKFAVTFTTMAEIAQEAFNYISEASNANFENERNNLQRQRDVALLFAGDSATAREEIERQFQERQRQIQVREAKARQRQAIFNIAIDTAQAIMAAVAKSPLTGGMPFAAIAAAIGAAQIALVASQQIPQFFKGTDNAPEGLAWTQEKGREIITDKKGRIKSLGSDKGAELTMLEKGDKVFTAEKSAMMFDSGLNSILTNNGILPPKVEVNMDTQLITNEIKNLAKTISNKPSFTVIKDKRGERLYQQKQAETKQLLNNILTYKGFDV
jgi:hypothetical protein